MERGPAWVCVLLPLCLLPGHLCGSPETTTELCTQTTWNVSRVPPAPPPPAPSAPVVMVQTSLDFQPMVEPSLVKVEAGLTSVTALEGGRASLECRFKAPSGANVTWSRACSWNCSEPIVVGNGTERNVAINSNASFSTLSFQPANKNDTGLYFCQVQSDTAWDQSCGTYLRVRKPIPLPFLNMRESTKNQLITAEGILLLLCAVVPGLFLLFRKRWENERLLQAKKGAYEEENLYEGLNLDECSMYEDISRGLQATYQDVANIRVLDMQLEKP
ncbi:B-cell antigen receptor complex-associated protein alpha chain [Carettochelys insculpta]|uniref:B-cell antigen receptor complex-associated protein alpha chain n=1 Tax=Carettochelys insculpta TaxID=44489 RepID=UPI003EB92535